LELIETKRLKIKRKKKRKKKKKKKKEILFTSLGVVGTNKQTLLACLFFNEYTINEVMITSLLATTYIL
jgi:hypothetical protein